MSTLAVAEAVRPVSQPAKVRRRIIAFGASLAFLSFLDRAAISQAAPYISRDLHLSAWQMGLVFSAFGFTYAAGEIPSGWLCDRYGARNLLTRVVIGWSLFTAATGWVWNFSSLFVTRLLFGLGESGCFPALARVFRTWLTPEERSAAEGIKAASARWGAAITPLLMTSLFMVFTWRQVFGIFGVVGIIWAIIFYLGYRDAPRAVVERHTFDWRALTRSRSVWALSAQWFCHYYGFYFYITWLPLYLYQSRGLDLRKGALAAGLPLFTAGLGSLVAGWAQTALTRRLQDPLKARRLLGYLAYGGASLLLVAFTWIDDPMLAMFIMSLSSFAAEFSGPISWTTAMDIGGERVGAVSGFMNTFGHLGGSVAPAVTGLLLSVTGNSWTTVFLVSALIYAAGALCWRWIELSEI